MASEFSKPRGSSRGAAGQAGPRSPASDADVHRATRGGAWRLSAGAGLFWCCPQITCRSPWNKGGTGRCRRELRGQKPVSEASSGEGRASRGLVG